MLQAAKIVPFHKILVMVPQRIERPVLNRITKSKYNGAIYKLAGLLYENAQKVDVVVDHLSSGDTNSYVFASKYQPPGREEMTSMHLIDEKSEDPLKARMYALLRNANVCTINIPLRTEEPNIKQVLDALFTKNTEEANKWMVEKALGEIKVLGGPYAW